MGLKKDSWILSKRFQKLSTFTRMRDFWIERTIKCKIVWPHYLFYKVNVALLIKVGLYRFLQTQKPVMLPIGKTIVEIHLILWKIFASQDSTESFASIISKWENFLWNNNHVRILMSAILRPNFVDIVKKRFWINFLSKEIMKTSSLNVFFRILLENI